MKPFPAQKLKKGRINKQAHIYINIHGEQVRSTYLFGNKGKSITSIHNSHSKFRAQRKGKITKAW